MQELLEKTSDETLRSRSTMETFCWRTFISQALRHIARGTRLLQDLPNRSLQGRRILRAAVEDLLRLAFGHLAPKVSRLYTRGLLFGVFGWLRIYTVSLPQGWR